MATFENTQIVNYDITGGDTDFEIEDKNGNKLDLSKYDLLYVQIEHTALDVGDSTLIFKRSAVGDRYTEPPGGTLLMDTGATQAADFSHLGLGAKFARISFIAGTDTVGTVENIHVIAKSK